MNSNFRSLNSKKIGLLAIIFLFLCRLVWIVHVKGEPKEWLEQGGDVIIDTHSGEIVEVDPYA